MDPLHPLVPIQPAAPTPPSYNRVERVERDHQRESDPNWGQEQDSRQSREEQESFEDDYDPTWGERATAEPGYGPDGHLHEPPAAGAPESESDPDGEEPWDPRVHGERRRHPRTPAHPGADGTNLGSDGSNLGSDGTDPGGDERSGPHIDISA